MRLIADKDSIRMRSAGEDENYTLNDVEVNVSEGAVLSGTENRDDILVNISGNVSANKEFDIVVEGYNNESILMTKKSGTGILTHNRVTGNGSTTIECKNIFGIIKNITVEPEESITTQIAEFNAWRGGSLGNHMKATVDALISGKSPAQSKHLYTTKDHTTATYVRNGSFWASPYDLTGISPWNSRQGNNRAGTLITPRHILHARHYPVYLTDTVRFVSADGSSFVDITVSGAADSATSDMRVATLNADVPGGYTYYKVWPSDAGDYLRQLGHTLEFGAAPALRMDQEEKGSIGVLRSLSGCRTELEYSKREPIYSPPVYGDWYENIVSGDSGNPMFTLINDELILMCCFTGGGGGSGPTTTDNAQLNALIAAADADAGVSTGYTVTPIDLSMWPNFTTPNYLIETTQNELWTEWSSPPDFGQHLGSTVWFMRDDANDGKIMINFDNNSFLCYLYVDGAQSTLIDSTTSYNGAGPQSSTFSTLSFSTP